MAELLLLFSRYGYTILFANLFLGTLGFPLPAIPVLMASGAACAYGILEVPHAVGVAFGGMLSGDLLLYVVGRYSGWALLSFICRLSTNPESCVLKSAQSFYRHGRLTIIYSKFVPGINTMAPPLAGSLNMRLLQFLGLDLVSICLYTLPFIAIGFFFSHLISRLVDGFASLSLGVEVLVLAALFVYLGHRLRYFWKDRSLRYAPRISVKELAEKISANRAGILVADTRSHGYYDRGASRIKGSIRLEPNNLLEEMGWLPKDKEIYLYCT